MGAIAEDDPIERFINRWQESGAAERANFQSFAIELCDVLGVDHPEPARAEASINRYCFEHLVKLRNQDGSTSNGWIDLYKRGCFVMEAKQGSDADAEDQLALFGGSNASARKGTAVRGTRRWTAAMQKARHQAIDYARATQEKAWPPFIIVVDVGHCIELFADFSLSGKSYAQFPDAQGFRIRLDDLRDPVIRERLARIWTDPQSLDPARHAE